MWRRVSAIAIFSTQAPFLHHAFVVAKLHARARSRRHRRVALDAASRADPQERGSSVG